MSHILHAIFRREFKAANVAENEIKEGTEWHDAAAITGAVIVLAIGAHILERCCALDGGIVYDAMAVLGTHPVSRAFKTVLVAIF